jgi:hypothetical protein
VDTGQHYDEAMAGAFFAELGLRRPDHSLGVGGTPIVVVAVQPLAQCCELARRATMGHSALSVDGGSAQIPHTTRSGQERKSPSGDRLHPPNEPRTPAISRGVSRCRTSGAMEDREITPGRLPFPPQVRHPRVAPPAVGSGMARILLNAFYHAPPGTAIGGLVSGALAFNTGRYSPSDFARSRRERPPHA